MLAAAIPGREDGTLAADGKSVTWKLKQGVTWHDGKPFTADDVVFNWEYAADPATAATTIGTYKDVKVEKVDDLTVKVLFDKPTPFWADAFVGTRGMIIPKHLFADYIGAKSREAPTNLKPVGTGPYKFKDFKPGDMVAGEINTSYHMENRPYFDSIEMKGGGDAVSAARAVLQTGEFDFAWNLQVEDEVLLRLEKGGKGRVVDRRYAATSSISRSTSPIRGPRSTASAPASRPSIRSCPTRRCARRCRCWSTARRSRSSSTAAPAPRPRTSSTIPNRFRSKNTRYEFNVDKANAILDKAGWTKGADGVRAKDGKKLKFVFQTSINQPRQKTQAIVKQACQKAGIDIEVKAVMASVFFSSDVANPDTYPHFYTDLQMYTTTMTQPDPEIFMSQFCSWEAATKDNKWQGRNITRWQSKEYDDVFKAAQSELDPVKRAALFIKMNDLVDRRPGRHPGRLPARRPGRRQQAGGCEMSGWDNNTWDLQNWFKEG